GPSLIRVEPGPGDTLTGRRAVLPGRRLWLWGAIFHLPLRKLAMCVNPVMISQTGKHLIKLKIVKSV
uniref:Uncharacterized protein n=1 Tax=Gorilla gorilla gorilla TaxID=9595 RepID=A0A2I2ZEM8_GORGO